MSTLLLFIAGCFALRAFWYVMHGDSEQRRIAQLEREARRTEAEPTLNDWPGPLRPQVHRPCTCIDCLKDRFEASA